MKLHFKKYKSSHFIIGKKLLTEIEKINYIKVDEPSFISINKSFDWKKIHIDQSRILNYHTNLEYYFCKVCLSLTKNPKSCKSCDDLLCLECFDTVKSKNNSCPNCRESPLEEYRINNIVKNTHQNIEFTCPLGCDDILTISKVTNHINLCEKWEKFFKCNQCLLITNDEKERDEHINKCKETIVKCKFCKNNFKNKNIDKHLEICNESLIICSKCLCKIPKKIEEFHIGYFCDLLSNLRTKIIELEKII